MKSGLHLFSRMYIACQATSGDMNTFFEHENHCWPLSLAENYLMRFGEKSTCWNVWKLKPYVWGSTYSGGKNIWWAALVRILDRNTFRDYANYHDYVFVPYLNK